MADGTNIGWAAPPGRKGVTLQVTAGCNRFSAGCGGSGEPAGGCFAERVVHRLGANPKLPHYAGITRMTEHGPRFTGLVRELPEALAKPLHWAHPRGILLDSLADLFHEDVELQFLAATFAMMAVTPHHFYFVLTKRTARMARFFNWLTCNFVGEHPAVMLGWMVDCCLSRELGKVPNFQEHTVTSEATDLALGWRSDPGSAPVWPLQNVILMTSVEDQKSADQRIPELFQSPAAMYGLSYEPALEHVDFGLGRGWCRRCRKLTPGTIDGHCVDPDSPCFEAEVGINSLIRWIVGGLESGPGCRPGQVEWLESMVAQCHAAGVTPFTKQDNGPRPERQGRIPDALWRVKEWPPEMKFPTKPARQKRA